MKRKYVFDEKKYKVKESNEDGCIYIIARPKKRNCKYCTKQFESVQSEILFWKDNNGYQRSGWFCKEHYSVVRTLLNEHKRLV